MESSIRGKVAILVMFGVSLSLAGYAWWNRYERTHRSLAFWGSDAARQIATATEVEFLALAPVESRELSDADPPPARITIAGREFTVASRAEIGRARGLSHASNALLEDASFAWNEATDGSAEWEFAVRFGSGESAVTVAFAPRQHRVHFVERNRTVVGGEKLMTGYSQKAQEWGTAPAPNL